MSFRKPRENNVPSIGPMVFPHLDTKYTMHLDRDQVSLLLENYNVGSLMRYYLIKGGAVNTSFYVRTAAGEFILTFPGNKLLNQSQSQTPGKVERAVDVLRHLEKHSFPAPKIILSNDGQYILNYSRGAVILKGYIKGNVIRDLSTNHLWQLGQLMARLHAIAPPQTIPDRYESGLEIFDEVFDYDHIFVHWLRNKKKFLVENIFESIPKGFIHGDIFYDNVIIDRDLVKAIIDFDASCNYFLIFDVGMCMVGTCMKDRQLVVNKAKSLLEGYQSVRTLSTLEKESLKIFLEYAAAAAALWRFRYQHLVCRDEKLKDSYLEMKQIVDNIHAVSDENFIKLLF